MSAINPIQNIPSQIEVPASTCGEKITALGTALVSLAKAVAKVALGSIYFLGYLLSLGCWQTGKKLGLEQFHKVFHRETPPQELPPPVAGPSETAAPKVELSGDSAEETKEIKIERPKTVPEFLVRLGEKLVKKSVEDRLQKHSNRAQGLEEGQELEPDVGSFKYLPAPPDFEGESSTVKVSDYEVGVCSFQGYHRPSMEDEHLATSFDLDVLGKTYPVELFGIFDGHGGKGAATYVKENLTKELSKTLHESCSDGLTDEAVWKGLKTTFFKLADKFEEETSGTTATVAMILDQKLWAANVGDSRTILDNGTQLSEDAKPHDPYYKKNIEKLGGYVHVWDFENVARLNGRLAVARAIGDRSTGAGVNPHPKITMRPLPKKSHLILACDGVYDVSSTKQIAEAVQTHEDQTAEELARGIVHSAYTAGSTDNISALVVKL